MGTSTGAIIAVCIGLLRMDLDQVESIYMNVGQKVCVCVCAVCIHVCLRVRACVHALGVCGVMGAYQPAAWV